MNLSDPWGTYALLQHNSDFRKLDAKAWAAEESAEEFLDALATNTLRPDCEACEAWLENLATNRAKKHRRRAALLRAYQRERPNWELSIASDVAEQHECVDRIRENTTSQEWSALCALSMGEDYQTIATSEDRTVSAIKTRISRCRTRLRVICA